MLGVRVETHHADVKILAVIKQLDFCRLTCLFALVRVALSYFPDWFRRFPIRLVEYSVYGDR
ncbi:MAG: hypothetical protein AUJ01_09460 [Acidobacteria bacterium 13_1_40CM_3_65_5]|nr:MAG: hypothetical protein AUJ01_09460 [Acidobacteria bacterium 13_1_40CM_3_65_5]